MSQQDIIKIIIKIGRPMSRREIQKYFPYNSDALIRALRQLVKHRELSKNKDVFPPVYEISVSEDEKIKNKKKN